MARSVQALIIASLVFSQCGCSAVENGTANSKATVVKATVGKMPDGAAVDEYTMTNGNGLEAKVLTYGATLTTGKCPL